MKKFLSKISCAFLLCLSFVSHAVEIQKIKILYITQERKVPAALSNLAPFIKHKGVMGAEIAIIDNNTTGQFTAQRFELIKAIVPVSADLELVFRQQLDDDITFVITNLSVNSLTQLADLDAAAGLLFFDARTTDDALRNAQCRSNILHMLPSRAMRADALAQYMMKKRWKQWFLVTGMAPEDKLYAQAIRRAAKRFGLKIIADKQWTHTYDARRTAQSDVPVFTQGEEYDVLVVADEQGLFGEYLDYRTWIPRPVVGTQGLVPTSWHRVHEQWGAVQIQNRFKVYAKRWMEEEDYAAYLAVRAIGEASVRTQSNKMQNIKDYLLSDAFALQGYKGRPLSFRSWNGQLRQPVLLAAARSLVSSAPVEGFLHPLTELDTLGFDRAESACNTTASKSSPMGIENDSRSAIKAQLEQREEKNGEGVSRVKRLIQRLIQRIKKQLKQFNWI